MDISQKDDSLFLVMIGDIVPANIMEIDWAQNFTDSESWSGHVILDRDSAVLECLTDEPLVVIIAERAGDHGYTEITFEHPSWRLSETWKYSEPTRLDLYFSHAKRQVRHLDHSPERLS